MITRLKYKKLFICINLIMDINKFFYKYIQNMHVNMAIKDKYNKGYSVGKLSKEYYLSESVVSRIINKT